jgi:predicted nucleic acid-binding protein
VVIAAVHDRRGIIVRPVVARATWGRYTVVVDVIVVSLYKTSVVVTKIRSALKALHKATIAERIRPMAMVAFNEFCSRS